MRVVLDTNVLVSAALNQKSMPGMAALGLGCRGTRGRCGDRQFALDDGGGRPLGEPQGRQWLG